MQHQYSKGLVLLVFTVFFKIEEKEFYIMDFKLGFEKLLLSWGLFDELYPQSWSFLHILFFLFLNELPNQN